jgi:hypothetical protein
MGVKKGGQEKKDPKRDKLAVNMEKEQEWDKYI